MCDLLTLPAEPGFKETRETQDSWRAIRSVYSENVTGNKTHYIGNCLEDGMFDVRARRTVDSYFV